MIALMNVARAAGYVRCTLVYGGSDAGAADIARLKARAGKSFGDNPVRTEHYTTECAGGHVRAHLQITGT